MQASDRNVSHSLAIDPAAPPEGVTPWQAQRPVFFDDEAAAIMREQLIRTLGADMARGILTGWGYELGRRDAQSLGRAFSWETDTELILLGPRLLAWYGQKSMKPKRLALNRARGLIDVEIAWLESPEAQQYRDLLGSADHAVCWTMTGYYSGYASTLLDRPVVAVETTCIGMGAEHCTVRLRGQDTWDLGATRSRAVLEPGHAVRLMQDELERLRYESSMRLNRLEALREAALDVTAVLSLDGVQAKIVTRGRVLLGARYAFLVITPDIAVPPTQNGHAQALMRPFDVVYDGLNQQEAAELEPFPIDTGLFAAVLRENQIVRVRRTGEDARARGMPDHPALLSSFLGVPLRVHGQPCGALFFTDRLGGGEFSLDDEKLCESFAAHAGVALENARLVDTIASDRSELSHALSREQDISSELHRVRSELERERELLRALVDIPTSPDVNSALHRVVERLGKLLTADVGTILIAVPDPDGRAMALQVRACLEQGQPVQLPRGQDVVEQGPSFSWQVTRHKDVLYVRDVTEEEQDVSAPHRVSAVSGAGAAGPWDGPIGVDPYLRGRGVRSLLGASLTVEGRLIGVVYVGSYAVRTFDAPEVRFLCAAANLIALSFEHARLHLEVKRAAQLLRAVIEAAPIGVTVSVAPSTAPGAMAPVPGPLDNKVIRDLESLCAQPPAGDAPRRALSGETVTREERTLTEPAGGTQRAVRVSAAPVLDEAGRVQAAVTVVEELTLEKEIERLRERFVSLVAHDLRNPLNAALMHLELLRERLEVGLTSVGAGAGILSGGGELRLSQAQLVKDSLKTADAIHRSMMRVSDLVSDLLDYSRIEAGQLAVYKNDVPLRPLVRELLDELHPLLEGRTLEVDIDEGLAPLRADRRRLAQVLTNLLTNALKYTSSGVRMGLRARPFDPRTCAARPADPGIAAGWVLLSVWDHGPGIPPEALPRIFDPFYRLSRDLERKEGTGLGLYITRGLVEAHGGQIWLDDVPGASFSMLWPST